MKAVIVHSVTGKTGDKTLTPTSNRKANVYFLNMTQTYTHIYLYIDKPGCMIEQRFRFILWEIVGFKLFSGCDSRPDFFCRSSYSDTWRQKE